MARLIQPLTQENMRARVAALRPQAPLGGCTRDTLRCRDATDYAADLRPCCRGHLRELVQAASALLDRFAIVWWADYGTLLGAVRDPLYGLAAGVIPHDKDADLGMLWPGRGRMRDLEHCLNDAGYFAESRRVGDNLKVRLSRMNRTSLDIFTWRERPDGTLYRTGYLNTDKFKGRDFRRDTTFPLESVQWEGLTLPAPRHPAAFCAFRYGSNWQTPIRRNNDGVLR